MEKDDDVLAEVQTKKLKKNEAAEEEDWALPPYVGQVVKTVEMHAGGEPLRIFRLKDPGLGKRLAEREIMETELLVIYLMSLVSPFLCMADHWFHFRPCVVAGCPTLLAKRRYIRDHLDHIRRRLMFEPRGHHEMYGAILVEPDRDEESGRPLADLAVLFIHNEGNDLLSSRWIVSFEMSSSRFCPGKRLFSIGLSHRFPLHRRIFNDVRPRGDLFGPFCHRLWTREASFIPADESRHSVSLWRGFRFYGLRRQEDGQGLWSGKMVCGDAPVTHCEFFFPSSLPWFEKKKIPCYFLFFSYCRSDSSASLRSSLPWMWK